MKATFLFLATLSLLTLVSLPHPAVSFRCNQQDYKVLLSIKQALGNPEYLAPWVEGSECCYWPSIGCDRKTNRINALRISNANISAQIPAAVGDLPYLEILVFAKITNLTGEIPQAIAKLTNLLRLTLSSTNLTGPVPSFLSNLKNLTSIDLSFNQLTGTIPPSLSKLQNLFDIDLGWNKLTGTIPSSFGKFSPSVGYILLSHNKLTGPVPKSMGNLNVTKIDFSGNQLSGDLSFFAGSSKTIDLADFSRNMFEFDITNFVFPVELNSVDLSHNKIYGSLPMGLTEMRYLHYLNVSYNRLCGKIPTGGNLHEFDETSYFHNQCLCGAPLSACK